MLAEDRGLILRSYMKDPATVDAYDRAFEESNRKAAEALDTIEPLLVFPASKLAVVQLKTDNREISEANSAVYGLASKGDPDGAAKIYVERFLPLQKEMKELSIQLVAAQNDLLKASVRSAEASTATSRWAISITLLLAVVVGAFLIISIMKINASLRESVSSLGESVGQVAVAATQIASTSQSLAEGASEQAATIEETSATSSGINSMARRNTENSRATAEMMVSSQERFAETSQSLQNMVAAMDGITASGQQISKIIKVIDEIAFSDEHSRLECGRRGGASWRGRHGVRGGGR